MNINLSELQRLAFAIDDVVGFETDNSCGDPDCCGGPYFTREQFDEGVKVMAQFGLAYVGPA